VRWVASGAHAAGKGNALPVPASASLPARMREIPPKQH
jgi:hypothetical protein